MLNNDDNLNFTESQFPGTSSVHFECVLQGIVKGGSDFGTA